MILVRGRRFLFSSISRRTRWGEKSSSDAFDVVVVDPPRVNKHLLDGKAQLLRLEISGRKMLVKNNITTAWNIIILFYHECEC
mmetsp:Transcript_26995/g.41002  ORF Transcript_26995/g.41002 Transcript_26995/m.41002 type:complete len:83 (-) Transcript_26995:78-326(-)